MADARAEAPIHALAAVIREAEGQARLEADAEAFLTELGLDEADRTAMLSLGPKRLMAYRRLVHNRVRNVVFKFLSRCTATLGEDRMREEVVAFLDARGIQSAYLREVPGEFVAWARPRWESDATVPAHLPQLATYELLSEELPNDARRVGEATELPVALDKGVRVNGTTRLLSFDWDLRQGDEATPPPAGRLHLLVCRDRKHAYRELEVDALAASLYAALAQGQTLQAAIFSAAEATGQEVGDPLLEAATYALAAMMDVDALLGAEG